MLTSQGVVLATAMAVSAGSLLLYDLLREKNFPGKHHRNQVPKSCLSSGNKKEKKNKKKRVQFADDVKDSGGNGELYRKQHRNKFGEIERSSSCGNEIVTGFKKMPANRAALYSGILRDRVHRMGYSC